jgi:hypothetical protein
VVVYIQRIFSSKFALPFLKSNNIKIDTIKLKIYEDNERYFIALSFFIKGNNNATSGGINIIVVIGDDILKTP